MKKIYLAFLFLLLVIFAQAQACSTDSVVKTFTRERGDDFINELHTDSFDVVNGIELYTMNPFARRFLELNSNYDTLHYALFSGTGSGYTNYSRIDFTYDSLSNLILSRTAYSGAGTSWNLTQTENWNYNGNDLLVDYTLTNPLGNIQKIIYNYNGSIRQSILYQTGSGSTWTNDKLFSIVYTSGIRDSLRLQKWDAGSSSWADSLTTKYALSYSFSAMFVDTSIVGARTNIDTYYLDTLDLLVREEHFDSIWGGQYSLRSINYRNIHSHQVVSASYGSYDGCTNENTTYSFDVYGVIIAENYGPFCGTGSGSSSSIVYDSIYRVIHWSLFSWSSVSFNTIYKDNYYSSYDSIVFAYVPTDYYGANYNLCQGEYYNPTVILSGGCGPYTFSWSPTTGLSSSTIASPLIHLSNDIITYTITVTDSTGHSSQSTFNAAPILTVSLSVDSSTCNSCPVILNALANQSAIYEWYRNDTLIPNAFTSTYTATTSGIYYVKARNNDCDSQSDTVLILLESLTRINGRIYWDKDSDCTFTAIDTSLSNFGNQPFFIGISRNSYNAIIIPNADGTFDIPLDTGSFVFKIYNLPSLLTPDCLGADSFVVYIPNYGDTITGADFPLMGDTTCNRLAVNVTSSQFRPCQQATISIQYFNGGLTVENNAFIDVSIPSELTVISASLPYTVLGNNFSFNLPSLSWGEYGTITINTDVICNTSLTNATLCIDAEINPKNFCSLHPDSTWDGSNVRVHSYCNNDSSACFILSNESLSANGNMNSSSSWRLYDDNILNRQGTFQLNSNADTTLCFTSNGSTYRLEVDQTTGFPTTARVASASIERCGPNPNTYTLQQIGLQSSNRNPPFYYIYCHSITNSFDPNAKSAQPVGLGPNHFIAAGEVIKYRIDFQNTGNDTAFKVVISDYINQLKFDLSTLTFIGSSHPFQYEINNDRVDFIFNDIYLPDSNANQFGSHGYVEFTVQLKPGLGNGIGVLNSANIYFDSNPPVATNLVTHEICNVVNPEVTIAADSLFCIGLPFKCKATILNGGNPPSRIIKWYKNRVLLNPNTDSLILSAGLSLNDTIYCVVTSGDMCAYPKTVTSNLLNFSQYAVAIPTINFTWPDLISTPAFSYQWYYNQTIIPGATFQNLTPTINGDYKVQVRDSGGCIALSEPFTFIDNGIRSTSNAHLIVYPNPAHDFINIEYTAPILSIKIIDAIGRTLIYQTSNSNSNKVNVKNIKSGRYVLEISTVDGVLYRPLILHDE